MKPQPRYQPGDKIGGRYQVHQALMGGMGEVYLCLDLETIQPFALKTFQQRFLTNPRLRGAFENEVATWVALGKHPNIVRCFLMKTLDNQPFMILEWIAGEEGRGTDLRGWLRRGPLDLQTAMDFTVDICRGLIHAQEKQLGLVHRDLKPENVLIAQGGLAKVTDFGLAEIIQEAGLELDAAGVEMAGRQSIMSQKGIAGTPAYMAPEQWRGESLDERTDIYALGCMLYEMLTGQWPFQVDFVPTTPGRFQQWLSAMQARHESGRLPALPVSLPAALGDLLKICLSKARAERPTNLSDLLDRLISLYHQQFDQGPPSRPEPGDFAAMDYNNRGFTYDELQQYENALINYDQAIQLDPAFAMAYNNRGVTYNKLRRYEEALADYDRAIQLDPTLGNAYNNRGITYNDLQRYDRALVDFSYAIRLNPDDVHAYNNRGNAYVDLHRYEEALADFDRIIQLDPNDAYAYNNRGFMYRELQQYDEALADFDRAIHLDPTNTEAYSNRGSLYRYLQRYEEALADYNQAILFDPSDIHAYNNRGLTYANLLRYEEALADYNQAIQLDPTFAVAYLNTGVVLGNQGRLQEALFYFEKATQLGHPLATQYATQARQMLGKQSSSQVHPVEQALEAFLETDSVGEMQQAVTKFPLMAETDFITLVEQVMGQNIPSEYHSVFEQRLVWLREIVSKQRPGLFGRFSKKREDQN